MLRNRTSGRRWSGAVVAAAGLTAVLLTPVPAGAAPADPPATAAEAAELVEQTAQQLTALDEQVHQAELAVAAQQQAAADADAAADAAEALLAQYAPVIRGIAQNGYTGSTQSRVAAFLGSESADDLVAQMTLLDLLADHTDGVLTEVSAAQARAEQARADADAAAAQADAALGALHEQQVQVQEQAERYEADFERLTAAEQARVTTALAGPVLEAPRPRSPPPRLPARPPPSPCRRRSDSSATPTCGAPRGRTASTARA
ncbi:hypothetical protein JD79_01532 [Geodermatophilus normandii]|uniref:Uncharacterized protein n=1 Tax=Geodermatophilus normandii TaxID=1137989 RepID=A0A317QHU7_9ACTN|nr:hypothetical protein [Geodermatophilus normandii]PWW22381.1 hypothetical protein JD79_01532 [Geodermatophilus normandii]